nr:pre T-cell antigen receptor alpha isoform X1 [Pogona vitticeps]
MPQPALKHKLPWAPVGQLLLTSAALQLLTSGSCTLGLTPTLSPPRNVIINGERKTLLLCLADDLSEDALNTIWFSSGNGSVLQSSSYGISREEDGTFSAVSHISISTQEFESWETVTCYVAQNQTTNWSISSLQISEENTGDLCLDESQEAGQGQTLLPDVLHSRAHVLLLLATRILLFKILLFDVLMTCCCLYKR